VRSLRGVVGLVLVLTSGPSCQKEGAPSSRDGPQPGDVSLHEELETQTKRGDWWDVSSFFDDQSGQWCYVIGYSFAEDHRSGIACFSRASLPHEPAKGQLEYSFVDEHQQVLRLVNETLGIVCLSHRAAVDCHRTTAVHGDTKAREAR
jgi:hypothetical protein